MRILIREDEGSIGDPRYPHPKFRGHTRTTPVLSQREEQWGAKVLPISVHYWKEPVSLIFVIQG